LRTNYLIIFFVLLLLGCKDSNQNKISNAEAKDSLSIYFTLANQPNEPLQKRIDGSRKALNLLKRQSNDSLNREKMFEVANIYFNLREWDAFRGTANFILNNAIESKDTLSIAKAYRYKAEYYKAINIKDSSYFFYLKAEKIYTRLNDKESLGRVFLKKGIIQFYANDYLGADISTSQAYNLLRNSSDKEIVYQAISMMGIISNEMKEYDKAIEKHTEALQLVREYNLNDEFNQEATSLNNIGNVYQNVNKNQEAVKNFRLALQDIGLPNETPDLYAILLDNLAYSKFKLKDYSDLPQLFFKALKIRDSMENSSGVVLSKIHISEFYAERKDTLEAQKFALESLETARGTKTPGDILAALKQLSAVEHKKAPVYSKEYIRINDSLQQAERKSQNKFARIQLETNEIIEEKDKLAEQNRNLVYFFIGTLLIGILLFVIRNQRARNRELLLVQAQQKANEEIYSLMISQQATIEESRTKEKKRIAQELHDGVLGRLFGARLNLDSLNKFSDDESIINRFNYLNELKNIEQDIREISHDLNREKYALINNFIAIVNNLLEEQKASYSPHLNWDISNKIEWDLINNAIKINLYRILQESLQNINKYAQAKNINIEIINKEGVIILKVQDDGLGFDVTTKKKGIGLQNMESRAKECNGIVNIKSKKGKGTSIVISVPILDITINTENL